jgi:hypothetical protein
MGQEGLFEGDPVMEWPKSIPGPYAPVLSLVMRFALSILGGSFLLGKAAEPGLVHRGRDQMGCLRLMRERNQPWRTELPNT